MNFWDAAFALPALAVVAFALALLLAFAFEFINGFHDTANAVTTVIYTRSLKATPAVLYSGFLNFLGVLLGGVGVAYSIVNLLPAEVVTDTTSNTAVVMVMALLISAVGWNFGTWYFALPVSSSHTLIGSILGVGLAYGLIAGKGIGGVKWEKAFDVGLGLLWSPLFGFVGSLVLLWLMKKIVRSPKLYSPPEGNDKPPSWIRAILIFTCGAVSFTHGSNDGQKGMGLIMLILIGFLAGHYALNTENDGSVATTRAGLATLNQKLDDDWLKLEKDSQNTKLIEKVARTIGDKKVLTKLNEEKDFDLSDDEKIAAVEHLKARHAKIHKDFESLDAALEPLKSFNEVPTADRMKLREQISRLADVAKKGKYKITSTWCFGLLPTEASLDSEIRQSFEWAPFWVILGIALALGIGTTIGYKRIVVTVAEKIGKQHLTYAQGMVAELVAAITIYTCSALKVPVSTTQILNSGVAGTMVANGSGLQGKTVFKIVLAWVFTLPSTMVLSGLIYWILQAIFVKAPG